MKIIAALSISFFIITNTYSQKIEITSSLNSTLFSYQGASSQKNSQINYSDKTNSGYTNNPYGSKNGLGYGISFKIDRITKGNIIYGLEVGYEKMRSKVSIDIISGFNGTTTYRLEATGETFLTGNYINYYTFLGYRFNIKEIAFDLTAGIEIGKILSFKEDGNATSSNGISYTTSKDRTTINSDQRMRTQLSARRNKFGLYFAYSHGFSNYLSDRVGGVNDSYSRIKRLGITYQIK